MAGSASERARGALGELRNAARPVILMVDHGCGGGVERHVAELSQALDSQAEILRLQPAGPSHVALIFPGARLWFDAIREWDALVETLAGAGVDRVHLHHVHGLPPAVLDLPRRLDAACWLTLHDFFPACPSYHLKDASLRFCGGLPDCGKCLESGASAWGGGVDGWRERFGALLARCERVIAPSADAARRLREFFPDATPVVWPHPRDRDAARLPRLRVLVPGAISVEKGLDLLEACVEDARARDLQLHFHVVGFLGRPLRQWPESPLTVSGQFEEGRLPERLAFEPADAFFFPAQVPETFSYTLSAALATGKPIVATNLGAFPERLANVPGARLLPWNAPARGFNEALLESAAAAPTPTAAGASEAGAYAARYLEGLVRKAHGADLPRVHDAWLSPPPLEARRSTLGWLFDDGIVAGKAASREELRRRLEEAEVEAAGVSARLTESEARAALHAGRAADLEAKLREVRAELQRAAGEADAARLRLCSLEASRSWRLLAPVRAIARWLGLTRT